VAITSASDIKEMHGVVGQTWEFVAGDKDGEPLTAVAHHCLHTTAFYFLLPQSIAHVHMADSCGIRPPSDTN
jgi:hypothetical protein